MRYWLFLCLLVASCGHRKAALSDNKRDASAESKPVDHLSTGELGQSKVFVFGFPTPLGMTVERRFDRSVYLSGNVSASALLDFVRAHAMTGPVERIGNRRVFSKVKIRGGDPSHIYDLEVDGEGTAQKLVISDVTPLPIEPGLTEEERWRRAGYNPDGTPLPSDQGL